jgi:S1-C subfamily serine protease
MKGSDPPLVLPPGGSVSELHLPVPILVHLSGSLRGTSQRLSGERLRLGSSPGLEIRVSPEPSVAPHHATLWAKGASYDLIAEPDCPIWVNGEPVRQRLLTSGDVLEIGRDGPLLRFRSYPPGTRISKSVAEAFSDGVDGARFRAGSPAGRVVRGLAGAARELATQTRMLFRVVVIVIVAALLASTGFLLVRSRNLEERLAREELRLEGLAGLLEESGRPLSESDLEQVRLELSIARGRIEALEARSGASKRVVASAAGSVILLQGAYGFVESESGKPLRFLGLGPDGLPLRSDRGDPLVAIGGDGPPVEAQFLGTAFVVSEDGLLLTNRHVALPWHYDSAAQTVVSQGLEPRMHRLIGYLPEERSPVDATFLLAAEAADVAILWAPEVAGRGAPLPLRRATAAPGEEVLVLGYPAGIRALLARADEAFVERLIEERNFDFWGVAVRLAEAGQVRPLASRGVVAQGTAAAVVYDAETTRGGSGGPVLDLDGEVVGVTSAIVSEFGGSNIGVPAERGRELLLEIAFQRLLPFVLR